MTDTIKANSQTGQVAVMRGGQWHVYDPGMYKINQQTGQIAIPDAKANGYEVHDAPDAVSRLSTPDAIAARQTGGLTGPGQNTTQNVSQGMSALRGGQQGLTLGLGDEIGGLAGGAVRSVLGDQAPIDPAHPVTGGQSSGLAANYLNQVGQERQYNQAAKESNPATYKGAFFAGSLLPSMALPANTMMQAGASGALQGGLLGAGTADSEDPKKLLLYGMGGAAGGGLLGAGARGLQRVAFDNNTGTGLAYNAVNAASPGGDIGNLQIRPSSMPAETNPNMRSLLRTAGAMNANAAEAAIPAARDRMGDVNQAIINRVGQDLSPEDAAALLQHVQQQGQVTNQANYAAAYANPTRVGLTPDITQRPSFQQALHPAQAAAADQMPPTNIDPTDLGVRDIDLVDRSLQSAQTAATESRGDTSQGAQVARALIPTRGQVATQVRQVADQAFPELATARAGAQRTFGLQDAIELGGTWMGSNKSPEQVGAEFAALNPEQQQHALAGFATDIRNTLGTKTARANLGQVFEKTGLADKLRNVGMPDDVVDNIVRGGAGAREVLNALEGGSMTARNLAGAEAMKSSMSQVKSGDLVAAGVLHSPAIAAALPVLRGMGSRAEQDAARQIIEALTTPGAGGLTSLINRAPQTWGGLLNAPIRSAGALLGAGALGGGV